MPVMLVGNKSDKVTEREVSSQEGLALARELGCEFVEASAKSCANVEKAFYDVVRLLRRQRQQTPRQVPRPVQSRPAGFGTGGSIRDKDPYPDKPIRHYRPRDDKKLRCVIL